MPANYIYTVYKTTNLVNGKIYIGKHTTLNPHDEYMGSGIHLKRAIKKYGKSKFIKEILYEYDNLSECYKKERELVDREFVKRDDTYNLNIGGCGNIKGRICEEEIRKKISNSSKGRVFSESHRRKKSLAQMGERNHRYGVPKTEDENIRMAKKMRATKLKNRSDRMEKYYSNPKLCPRCDAVVSFTKPRNTFCCKDCSNKHRAEL